MSHRSHSTAYFDISSLKNYEDGEFSPLPGYPIVSIETAWQVYYVAFASEAERSFFMEQVEENRVPAGET